MREGDGFFGSVSSAIIHGATMLEITQYSPQCSAKFVRGERSGEEEKHGSGSNFPNPRRAGSDINLPTSHRYNGIVGS